MRMGVNIFFDNLCEVVFKRVTKEIFFRSVKHKIKETFMKKFIVCLLACVACLQTNYSFGAISAYNQSLSEYNAILESISLGGDFYDVFAQNDFIVDLHRQTGKLNVTSSKNGGPATVYYILEACELSKKSKCKKGKPTKYLVTLTITPPTGPGAPTVTVDDVSEAKKK